MALRNRTQGKSMEPLVLCKGFSSTSYEPLVRVYILLNRKPNRLGIALSVEVQTRIAMARAEVYASADKRAVAPETSSFYVSQSFCIARRSRAVSLSSSALLQNINGAPNEALKHRDLFSR